MNQINKHHFFTPFKHLRNHKRSSDLDWLHIIAVPQYRFDQYVKKKSNKKYLLFKNYSNTENVRKGNLSFSIVPLDFNKNEIIFRDVQKHIAVADIEGEKLIKREYELIKRS